MAVLSRLYCGIDLALYKIAIHFAEATAEGGTRSSNADENFVRGEKK